MNAKEVKDLVCAYEMGMATGNDIITRFVDLVDINGDGKFNPVAFAVVQERDKLLEPLTKKCLTFLEMVAAQSDE